ncbi:hypothetical protein COU54_01765 [Candidatus Pacearchaeota archaeon CG10_big_fil_rev_8_21_14_0_10_31_24]|nr:MAG: hypothetical protein COU54_01765 [Candidatus Pacearchaeota archaeon CG10_big_fil_rev_8_21_14_0_10_31_24]
MIEITLPDIKNEDKNVKDLVFSILTDRNSRTLTQIHKEIKKVYGMSVSFQAVMKATNYLIDKKILLRNEMTYTISSEWIFKSRNFIDRLYRTFFNVQEPIKKVELGKEITIYTVSNLLELDRLWNDLLMNWTKNEKSDKRNVWKGKHCWWLIPRLHEEDLLHDFMMSQKIITYNLLLENTLMDKIAVTYYKNKGGNAKLKSVELEKDQHMSAFGEFLLKFEIPEDISKRLERIYNKTNKIENLNLKEVLDVFKENRNIEVTVIRDKMIADKIKEDIISFF